MSDLIDRYLAAIARELPAEQRADITAELRDELMSRVEADEDRLGRPMTVTELEAVLRDFGNPLVVAGRYRRTQHLIGPLVFPFWWQGIKVTMTVIAAVYVVLFALSFFTGRGGHIAGDVPFPTLAVVFTFGVVTLVFALIERFGHPERLARHWEPGRLPPPQGRTKSRFEILVEMGMTVVALAWWFGLVRFHDIVPGTRLSVELASVWQDFFWTITAYFIAELVVNAHTLLRPARVRLNGILAMARNLTAATILFGVRQADHFVEVRSVRLSPEALASVQAQFERGVGVAITVAIVVFLGLAVWEIWRLGQFLRLQPAPSAA